jgi:hypothetical protein
MLWMRGIRFFKEQGYFVAWNEESLNIYEYNSKKRDLNFKKQLPVLMTIPCAIFDDLTTKEDFVTDVLMFS